MNRVRATENPDHNPDAANEVAVYYRAESPNNFSADSARLKPGPDYLQRLKPARMSKP